MPRYAVSYINWYDHELSTKIVEAENEIEAYKAEFKSHKIDLLTEPKTVQDFKYEAFDADCMIHVEPIP